MMNCKSVVANEMQSLQVYGIAATFAIKSLQPTFDNKHGCKKHYTLSLRHAFITKDYAKKRQLISIVVLVLVAWNREENIFIQNVI